MGAEFYIESIRQITTPKPGNGRVEACELWVKSPTSGHNMYWHRHWGTARWGKAQAFDCWAPWFESRHLSHFRGWWSLVTKTDSIRSLKREEALKQAFSALDSYKHEIASALGSVPGLTGQPLDGRRCAVIKGDTARRCIASSEAEIWGETSQRSQRLSQS